MKRSPPINKRVVIINDMLWGGGRERRIVQLIAGLNRLGLSDITLIMLDERVDYPEVFGLEVEIIKILRSSNRDFSVFPRLGKVLRERAPCIVNPWSYMSVFYAAPICALLGIPCLGAFVVDAKPPKPMTINWLAMKVGFMLCGRIIGNSQAGHEAYGTPYNKRLTIYNGFDPSRLAHLKKGGKVSGHVRIAMIGRLDKQKDYQTYIDALSLLSERGVDFQAYIVGQGEDEDTISDYARKKCGDKIKVAGFVRRIDDFIATIDIGVLCTDPDFHAEGISNAVMELMAQAKPVVATDGGGTPEIVSDGVTGFLVPPGDPRALADRLQQLCSDAGLRSNLGMNSAATVASKFTLDRMSAEFVEAYREYA